ncbi:hypothetical protein [Bacteroides sp.]|uniref:hypothetical protein n=1 Tax=Bacteroides sp. TaxID=29523 RepID=UPI00260B2CE3|nr:hypothetical protein [Bacteroides sp.]MDD3037119.1 hypothetical protein [Bacteroides sp.]
MRQLITFSFLVISLFTLKCYALNNEMSHDPVSKKMTIADPDQKLVLQLVYSNGCKITQLKVKGKNVLSESGVYTGFTTKGGVFTSYGGSEEVKVEKLPNKILIKNIVYGDQSVKVNESWSFELVDDKILWNINREYSNLAKFEETALPQWNFADLSIWKGGILDNGGMVWCKYLSNVNDTYGVHTGGVTFWNPDTGNALRIKAISEGKHIAAKYSQSDKNEFVCTHFVTDEELEPRYELSRFVHQKADVFSPFDVRKGAVSMTLEMKYVDYAAEYSRGTLPGIDAEVVRELMNTTGRYGVVDNAIVGANGWTTNWKCLHEPFFSQIGMALNDGNYIRNMSSTLDRERDYAMKEDGRVLSRWHNAGDDQIPGTFNYKTGYYEARWGYTIDSQTGYVINAAEQFDLCGDIQWLQSHKVSCEKALDWLIKRDSNGNGIFEMMNNSIKEEKASDWLDIVWASFENAFVNAQMYEALNLWAGCERVLGDKIKSDYYTKVALKLKENFNKAIYEGGFWSPEKKQYVYWRDKDGSVHGDNLVTPVNFAVIAFGLCDDKKRISQILQQIEKRTTAENLFHWPLCFDSFKREEVSDGNWPFPTYENGDIFPTWGYLGVRAYVGYDKHIALKYIRNILAQYKKDGLSSQRYSRKTQEGQGSDILAGICTSVTALYRDIYGIRPRWNRMGLEPNMSEMLNGTEFNYTLRDIDYRIRLNVDDYEIQTDKFSVKCREAFGVSSQEGGLIAYPHNKEKTLLKVFGESTLPIDITLKPCFENDISWEVNSTDDYRFVIQGLNPALKYKLVIQNKTTDVKVEKNGKTSFTYSCKTPVKFRLYGK